MVNNNRAAALVLDSNDDKDELEKEGDPELSFSIRLAMTCAHGFCD